MRTTLRGSLVDISCNGIGIRLSQSIEIGENVAIDLSQPAARTKLWVRGCVKYVKANDDGSYRVGCSLVNRLAHHQVLALRGAGRDNLVEIKGSRESGPRT